MMTDFLLSADQLRWAARSFGKRFSETGIAAFTTLYNAVVAEGDALHPEIELPIWKAGWAKQSVACNLLRRFRKHAQAVHLFIRVLAVPFINNVAERAVRMPTVKQRFRAAFAPSKALTMSVSFAPALIRCASSGTECWKCYSEHFQAILSSPLHRR